METTIVSSLIEGGVTVLGSVLALYGLIYTTKKKALSTLEEKLEKHREEYLTRIDAVENSISAIKADNDKWQSVIRVEIQTLSDRQEKNNKVIERTFHLEERASVLEEKVRVANHRIEDLEKHE